MRNLFSAKICIYIYKCGSRKCAAKNQTVYAMEPDPYYELLPLSPAKCETKDSMEDLLQDEGGALFFGDECGTVAPTTPRDPWQESFEKGVERGKVEIMRCDKTEYGDKYTVKPGCECEVEGVLGSIEQAMLIQEPNYKNIWYDSDPQEIVGVGLHGIRRFAFRGWQVVSLERIQNRYVRRRFLDFGRFMMDSPTSELVFHGTGEVAADCIATGGFSEKHVMRGVFGLGINTSSSILTSLQFCKAFLVGKHIHYKVIVSEYYKGHSTVGTTNQRDFGETEFGEPIMTLTAPPEKGLVNVAKYADQLCPQYEVTLIIDTTREMTQNEIRTVTMNAAPFSNYFILEWIAAGNIENERLLLEHTKYTSILENLKNKSFLRNSPAIWSKAVQPVLPVVPVTPKPVVSAAAASGPVAVFPGGVVVGTKRSQSSNGATQQPATKVAKESEKEAKKYGFRVPCTLTGWTDLTTSGARNIENGHSIILKNNSLLCIEYVEFVNTMQHFKVVRIMQSLGNMIFFYLRPVTQDTRDKIEKEIWPVRSQLFERFLELPKDCIVCKKDSMIRF